MVEGEVSIEQGVLRACRIHDNRSVGVSVHKAYATRARVTAHSNVQVTLENCDILEPWLR